MAALCHGWIRPYICGSSKTVCNWITQLIIFLVFHLNKFPLNINLRNEVLVPDPVPANCRCYPSTLEGFGILRHVEQGWEKNQLLISRGSSTGRWRTGINFFFSGLSLPLPIFPSGPPSFSAFSVLNGDIVNLFWESQWQVPLGMEGDSRPRGPQKHLRGTREQTSQPIFLQCARKCLLFYLFFF